MTTIPYSSAAFPQFSVPRCASAPKASCLNSASLPDLRKSVNHLSRLCMTGFLDRDGSFYAASEQFPIYGADNRVQISRLGEVVIHFHADATHCAFKSRIPRQQDCHGIGIGFSHGLDDRESITFPVNIDIREQHIEAVSLYRRECLRNIGCDLHVKSALLQKRRKRQTNARFIIHEEKLVAALSLCGNSS